MKSASIAASLRYVQNPLKGGDIVLSSGVAIDATPEQQAYLLEQMSRPTAKYKCHHIVLSHSPEDAGKITPENERDIIASWFQEMGDHNIDFNQVPWMLVRHDKQNEQLHYHLVALTTTYQGKYFKDSFIGAYATKAAASVSMQFGLTAAAKAVMKQERTVSITTDNDKDYEEKVNQTMSKVEKFISRKHRIKLAKERKEKEQKAQQQKGRTYGRGL